MGYPSVDGLQKLLTRDIFHYAKDAKKAAGRALGTLVEIITFYCLKAWGLERHTAIERRLPEYANSDITHNVEYSLHPAEELRRVEFGPESLPLTARKVLKAIGSAASMGPTRSAKSNTLLTKGLVLRNSCTLCDVGDAFLNAYLDDLDAEGGHYTVVSLARRPFAIFECKRVGVEEGMRKGPQTIEKAKQGAYVARSVSSLQKVRLSNGALAGFMQMKNGSFRCEDYYGMLADVIASDDPELLSRFILTVGVVSNHGNWFTSDNHNKELKVLAHSYDWLLFLTDGAIAQFIEDLLLHPAKEFEPARRAFVQSYTGRKGANRFTKVRMALDADAALREYFGAHEREIEGWFNIIAPARKGLRILRRELDTLRRKKWQEIHP